PDLRGEVLEIGIGPGILACKYSDGRLHGCEISENRIEIAQEILPNARLTVAYAENLPYEPNSFDAIILSEVLYYATSPLAVLEEAKRVLKPQGQILVLWGNSLLSPIYKLAAILKLRPKDPFGLKTFKIEELQSFATRSGLEANGKLKG